MHRVLDGLVDLLGRVVSPARCAGCDADLRHGRAFCAACVSTLVRAGNPDPQKLAMFVYGGAIAEALRRFKFDERPDLASALLAGIHPHLADLSKAAVDIVVPVPLHPARLVERGYNQAALLARPLSRRLGLPCLSRALRRPVATARQTDLSGPARAANVDRAFVAADPVRLAGRVVLLVDDVETTGSTLAACGRALLGGGARAVRTLVVARADLARGARTP